MSILFIWTWIVYIDTQWDKWVKNIDKIKKKLMRIKNNSSTGYVLEVDLEYPQKFRDIHIDYPSVLEEISIPKDGYLIIV